MPRIIASSCGSRTRATSREDRRAWPCARNDPGCRLTGVFAPPLVALPDTGVARSEPSRRLRWVVCLTYVGLALFYNALTPIGESPDEIGHFEYVRLVADHARLPG